MLLPILFSITGTKVHIYSSWFLLLSAPSFLLLLPLLLLPTFSSAAQKQEGNKLEVHKRRLWFQVWIFMLFFLQCDLLERFSFVSSLFSCVRTFSLPLFTVFLESFCLTFIPISLSSIFLFSFAYSFNHPLSRTHGFYLCGFVHLSLFLSLFLLSFSLSFSQAYT